MPSRFDPAVNRRASLQADGTDAWRLIDGTGDGVPGLALETFAGRWLASTTGPSLPPGFENWVGEKGVSCYWKKLDRHERDSPLHLSGPEVTEPFLMREHGLAFEISFQAGYSQGIFLDQRDNRAEVIRRMSQGGRLLNTFAYTGAFSVAAASAGAETTTLDLSRVYLDWAKRNFSHNGFDPAAHHFCKGDTFHWLKRFAKQGRTFDGIVLDPPTFSRDEDGKVFRVENDFGELAALAARVLAPGGWLLCSTNFRGIDADPFQRQLRNGLARPARLRSAPMPADFTGESYLKSIWVDL